jgi:hypothetical protein
MTRDGTDDYARARVTLVRGDMRDFAFARTFRLITIPFRPFQHLLTVADQRCCLANKIAGHDRFNQTIQVELMYHVTYPDGREERLTQEAPMRYLFRFEAEHLLARCGFEVEALYAGSDKSAFGSVYPGELIFVARKSHGAA